MQAVHIIGAVHIATCCTPHNFDRKRETATIPPGADYSGFMSTRRCAWIHRFSPAACWPRSRPLPFCSWFVHVRVPS